MLYMAYIFLVGVYVCVFFGSIASKSQIMQLCMATGIAISSYSVYHLIISFTLLVVMVYTSKL
jgi:low affinity Fe/Cu permease